MKNLRNRKYGYRAAAVLAAITMAGTMPLTSFAASGKRPNVSKPDDAHTIAEPPAPDINKDISPEFAYSEDKWASLRDNVLEFGELKDLVHEYNPTVRSNRSTYKDQKGKDLNAAYDDYMDDIDAIWNNADSDDDVAWATARFQVGVLQQQADNNYQDADMEKIQYDQTEAGLVYQAQQLMVTYEQSRYNLENLQSARNLLQSQYEATVARQAAGMATQADVLSALKSVQDQDTAILSAQKSADNVHRSLCLMLGWAVDGQPEIRDVPEPDLNRIASMNPDADMETAIANNYDVKYFEKKAGNLTSQYLIDSNQAQIQDAKDKAAKSLRNQYNAVLTGRDSLNAAVMALDVASVNLNTSNYLELLKSANYSLEYSKMMGKNRMTVFSRDILADRERRLELMELLRESVERGFAGFTIHYQPQVDTLSGRLCGAEALARWHCSKYGDVSPGEFIPLMEQSGLIIPFGQWILSHSMAQCLEWSRSKPDFQISVNLSYIQLTQGDFISFLRTVLEENSLAPSRLIMELTETYLAKAEEDTLRLIAQMKELGVKIAMDDFGVGYSSLFSLKSIPVDVVKIDRGFVKGITSDLFNATFIRSITDLCHDVGRKVCLEGVETKEEYEAVRELGMEYIQGYYFGRPMSARQFEDRLKE